MGGCSEVIVSLGWSWMVAAKLWLVVGGGGWSWMVEEVVGGRGLPHDLVITLSDPLT